MVSAAAAIMLGAVWSQQAGGSCSNSGGGCGVISTAVLCCVDRTASAVAVLPVMPKDLFTCSMFVFHVCQHIIFEGQDAGDVQQIDC